MTRLIVGLVLLIMSSVPLEVAAEAVRWCESRDRNVLNQQGSSASGYYQAIDGTWEWVMDLPAPAMSHGRAVQDEFFIRLWDGGRGARHWAPSRYCWEGRMERGILHRDLAQL